MKWTILLAVLIVMIYETYCHPGKSINVIINCYNVLFIVKNGSTDEKRKINNGINMICVFVTHPITK